MNIVAIDPSLTCTAMVINGKRFVFASHSLAHTKKGALTRWFNECSTLIDYNFIDYEKADGYSDNEIVKLLAYEKTVKEIQDTICKHAIPYDTGNKIYKDETWKIPVSTWNHAFNCQSNNLKVLIEGYSYSSQAGPLIDLVTFSTLLRKAMLELTKDVTIYAPTQLKLKAAELTYEPIQKGKKVIKYEYRNQQGVSGGQFTKLDMLKCLIDNEKFANDWVHFLKTNKNEILNYKSVPKPIEDVNDAMLLFYIGLNSL